MFLTYCDVPVAHHLSLTVCMYVYVSVAADAYVRSGPMLCVTYCDVFHLL